MDITLKGDNTIDGSEAIDKVTEGGEHDIPMITSILRVSVWAAKAQVMVRGPVRVVETNLTISGGVEKTETAETDTEETELCGCLLTISDTTGGLVMADGLDAKSQTGERDH